MQHEVTITTRPEPTARVPVRRPPRGVIVEGPDCSGKTTLIKGIKALLSGGGWDALQMGHRPGDQFSRYLRVYLDAHRVLLDRSHFSEVIYGDLWRSGRHFAPWEHGLLDRLAREEFVIVLCTSPADVLADRYMARPLKQVPMSRDEITRVHGRFNETVGAYASFVFDTHPLESFSFPNAARSVVDSLKACGFDPAAGPTFEEMGRRPRFIVLEGPAGAGKSAIARLLATRLPGWHLTTLDGDPEREPFRRFMGSYLGAERAIIDGGHLTHVITDARVNGNLPADAIAHVCRYVATRGVIVLCERQSPEGRMESACFLDVLQRVEAPYYRVYTSDSARVAEVVAIIAARVGEIT